MAEEVVSIKEQTFDFPMMGKTTITKIDLFDECTHGADKHYLRGSFNTIKEVAEQIAYSVESHEEYGCGNPLDKEATSGIGMNRYNVPDKKHWIPADKNDKYPEKAKYAVSYILRLFSYRNNPMITIGVAWDEKLYKEDGSVNEKYPTAKTAISATDMQDKETFKVLETVAIAKQDAEFLLEKMREMF